MPKTIEQGFESFLSGLGPLYSEHNKVKSHKDSVKTCLENNLECYDFIEIGSFGNGTGVRHYSDTDYFAIMPSKKIGLDSANALRKIKKALMETFWNTDGICVKKPSVCIPFGKYASETLEVTPAIFEGLVKTPVGRKPSFIIPNYSCNWMRSSPQAHNSYVKKQDVRLSNKLKPLIRLIKAWKFYNNIPISSFYLELRTTKFAESNTSIVYDLDIKRIVKFLYDNDLPSIQDPMGISGYIKACSSDAKRIDALSKLKTGYSRAIKAFNARDTNLDDAFYYWNLFFGTKFPSR